ncbi:hypothetical protein [Pseudomonas fluorescens]|uniref:hypothetical protein n=1 Tax=Pseudomonas fluorescens TaxID=294 RepID=UPI001C4598B9|nr:hypothetical protein [Pseudomonas fluorescens]QXN47951.1 hypothetical protein KW062_16775 [Pseudomonas fluorescens]WSO22259.1 hypothetical protein VUJ50_16875 [Pseudomonas fluorescens]
MARSSCVFASNVGASGEFDVAKGTGAFKGEANAALTVASGKVSYTAYVPDRLGWALRYTDDRGNDFNMGLLRLCLTPELTGFVGASVQIEGQLQIARSGDQQVLMGQPGGRLPRFHERKTRGAVCSINKWPPKTKASASPPKPSPAPVSKAASRAACNG